MRYLLIFFFFWCVAPAVAQVKIDNARRSTVRPQTQIDRQQDRDNLPDSQETNTIREFERPPIDLYKIISVENDTTLVDTSLTVQKFYKYNYLRRDRFDLLPFSNTGQTHNTLLYEFDEMRIKPLFGARARHFNYMEVDDTYYYEVPTPLTELYYKSVFEQGQTLDAFFTMNTSRRFNFSIAYKGLRSLGKYQNILTSTGNFRFTFNYRTKNDRYSVKAHYVAQDLLNRENGGLQDQALENFRSNDEEFDDRSRLNVNFENAESVLDGQRFYINHGYDIIDQRDSLATNRIRVGHILNFRDKFFDYAQQAPAESIFGESFASGSINDRVDLEDFNNQVFVEYSNKTLGQLKLQANHSFYDYGYNTVLEQANGNRIPNKIQGNLYAAGASYSNSIGGFNIEGEAEANISGDFEGYAFAGSAGYRVDDLGSLRASLRSTSRPSNYNHLLYQSSYRNYNWYNAENYSNVKTNTLAVDLKSDRFLNAKASLTNINDYAYFATDPTTGYVNSFQSSEAVTYLKIKVNKEFRVGKFALNNTIAYQNVSSGQNIFNVPELITRNTLYYTDEWFDKALFVQTGINFKYFTKYNMDAYDPVLAEFYVQNEEELGAFPLFDVFFNMKIRQTRVFVIAEHANSFLTGNDFFSAPGYPYRDFNVRFGIVWNLFL